MSDAIPKCFVYINLTLTVNSVKISTINVSILQTAPRHRQVRNRSQVRRSVWILRRDSDGHTGELLLVQEEPKSSQPFTLTNSNPSDNFYDSAYIWISSLSLEGEA